MHILVRLLLLLIFSSSVSYANNHSKTSDILAVVGQSGTVEFYDAKSHLKLGTTKVDVNAHEITLSPDGNTAYVSNFGIQDYDETVGTPGDTISVIDTHTFKETSRISTGTKNAPHGLKIRPNHPDELYVNTEIDGKILVINLASQTIKKAFEATPGTHNFIFSPDGNTLWLMAAKNGVTKMDPENGQVLGSYQANSPIRGLQYTPNLRSIMLSAKNEIRFMDPDTLKTVSIIDHLGVDQILYSAMDPSGKIIVAPAVWNNEVLVIDAETKEVKKRIVTGLDPVNVVIDDRGRYAYVSNARGSQVTKIDLVNSTYNNIDTQAFPNGLAIVKGPHQDLQAPGDLPKYRLGVVLPLSGVNQKLGRDIMQGFEFWKESFNRTHGNWLEILYEDMQSDHKKIRDLAISLKYQDNYVHILIGYDGDHDQTVYADVINYMIPFIDNYDPTRFQAELIKPYATDAELREAFKQYYNLTMSDMSVNAYVSLNYSLASMPNGQ